MSKRKKNNELERTKRVARECLKDCAVLYVSGNQFKSLVSLKHEAQVMVTPSVDAAVHKLRWHWTVLIAAFCRSPDGQEYMKAEELAPDGEYFYSELADVFNDFHHAFINDAVNRQHLVGVGWLAIPRRGTICEEQAEIMFSKFGAFDALANWQVGAECPTQDSTESL